MKKVFWVNPAIVTAVVLFITTNCKDEKIVTLPVISSISIDAISDNYVDIKSKISSDGGSNITIRGVCWSTTTKPDVSDSKTTDSKGIGSYKSRITGLAAGTAYYVRAYATNTLGTAYSEDITFSTEVTLPVLATSLVSDITDLTATCGGNITYDGGGAITARGVCWSTTANPTIFDFKTSDDSGVGSFTSNITELSAGTTYHVRAYASNSLGTAYGSDITFKTLVELPSLTTNAVTDITSITAVCGGNISSDGGSPVIVRGVCWSTNTDPTTADSKTENGDGIDNFVSNISGLMPQTDYYVRAYASNSAGTSYGNQISFTTLAEIPTNGLAAYYPFNGNADDESGNGHNGTLNGALLIADRFGNSNSAYYFNGIDNKIILGNNLIVQGQISISLWVRSNATSGQIISTGSRNSYRIGKTIDGVDSGVYLTDSSDGYGIGASAEVDCSDWTHVVLVYNGTDLILYINGEYANSSAGAGDVFCNQTVYLNFGAYQWGGTSSDWYNGDIDDVRLYDRPIDIQEIEALFHEVK